jgi:amidophosphoribosyltransferase
LSFIEIWNCFLRNTEDVFANGKQHNRGQDGAGFASIKLDMEPGERYISRVRSNHAQPIQDVFAQINDRVNEEMAAHPEYADNVALQKQIFRM